MTMASERAKNHATQFSLVSHNSKIASKIASKILLTEQRFSFLDFLSLPTESEDDHSQQVQRFSFLDFVLLPTESRDDHSQQVQH